MLNLQLLIDTLKLNIAQRSVNEFGVEIHEDPRVLNELLSGKREKGHVKYSFVKKIALGDTQLAKQILGIN